MTRNGIPEPFTAAPMINVVRRYRGEQQALQWDGKNTDEIRSFCGGGDPPGSMYRGDWAVRERNVVTVYTDEEFRKLFQAAAGVLE